MRKRLGARGVPAPDGGRGAERSEARLPEGGAGTSRSHVPSPRRRWTPDLKQSTVEAWAASGKSGPVFGREQGIDPAQLYKWRRELSSPFPVVSRRGRPRIAMRA